MAKKDPMRFTQGFKDNITGGSILGAAVVGGSMASSIPGMIVGGLAGAALGAGMGVAMTANDARKARKAQASANQHPALGRQFD